MTSIWKKGAVAALGFAMLGSNLLMGQCCPQPREAPLRSWNCDYYDDPCCFEGSFFFGGEGLYWNVYQTNLDYAVTFDNTLASTHFIGTASGGKVYHLDYDWDWGARGYVGFQCGDLDIRAVYTWFETEDKAHVDTTGTEINLRPIWVHPATPGDQDVVASARAKTELTYETADLLFGRAFDFCDSCFNIHPFIGARALKFEQEFRFRYSGIDLVDEELLPESIVVNWESEVEALGLHGGFDMYYRSDCGLGIYGSFSGSILASRPEIKWKQRRYDNANVLIEEQINLKEKPHHCIPGYHLAGGFTWSTCCGGCFEFLFRAGYEFNEWFIPEFRKKNGSALPGGSAGVTTGHVCFHGATMGLDLSF